MTNANAFAIGFRVVGSPYEDRRLVNHAGAFVGYSECDERADVDREAYLSAFVFNDDLRSRADQWGRLDVRGYDGSCWSPWLWFDIDREDLDTALRDARRLAAMLDERYRLPDDGLLVFFSGSKGFHLGLPTCLWSPEPGTDFHRVARRFAEHVAELAGVAIDSGVFDKARLFRAPNSRHPRTGMHKRRFNVDELLNLSLAGILERSKSPEPFDLPTLTKTSDVAADDWQAAAERVAIAEESRTAKRSSGSITLNRSTLDFIRDGAGTGDRHRLLFSAAANLAEFGCPPALAHALLSEAALDSGLPPFEVRRQIECGLSSVPSPSPDAGDQEPTARESTGEPDEDQAVNPPTGSTSKAAPDLRDQLARLWSSSPTSTATATNNPAPPTHQDDSAAKGPTTIVRPATPTIPLGAKLHFANAKMRPCSPAEAVLWTWEGASQWFRTSEVPVPQFGKGGAI